MKQVPNKASEAVIRRIWEMTAKRGPIGLSRMKRLLELLGNPEEDLNLSMLLARMVKVLYASL